MLGVRLHRRSHGLSRWVQLILVPSQHLTLELTRDIDSCSRSRMLCRDTFPRGEDGLLLRRQRPVLFAERCIRTCPGISRP